jgi:hypothetical protein
LQENNPDRSISKKHNGKERHVCVKDDLSAASVADIIRCAKGMEKLPHYYFPRVDFFQKQRQMLAASSGDKTIDQKYLESF